MNILFYSSFNSRARDAETLMIAFKKQGHRVLSLTQAEGKNINDVLFHAGIDARSYITKSKNKIGNVLQHTLYLIRLCKKENIDIIYCHLEPASFIGILSQYFIKAKVYLCRHHIDEALLYNFSKSITYRLTYRLAKKIIVVSEKAKKFMIETEGVAASKIIHINLAYDFTLFNKPNAENVAELKKKFSADILLLTVGRLTQFKRPQLSIDVLKMISQRGIDAKLIILGNGEMFEPLKQAIRYDNLEHKVFFTGHVQNVLDYMAASTFLLHPSILESSCVVVKEAGLIGLPAIVCQGVGDFDEYLVNGENGFLANHDNFVSDAVNVIQMCINDGANLKKITTKLNQDIIRIFSVDKIIDSYKSLNA